MTNKKTTTAWPEEFSKTSCIPGLRVYHPDYQDTNIPTRSSDEKKNFKSISLLIKPNAGLHLVPKSNTHRILEKRNMSHVILDSHTSGLNVRSQESFPCPINHVTCHPRFSKGIESIRQVSTYHVTRNWHEPLPLSTTRDLCLDPPLVRTLFLTIGREVEICPWYGEWILAVQINLCS